MQRSQVQEALRLAWKQRVFTAEEAARHGIHSQILTRLVREGAVERIARVTFPPKTEPFKTSLE